MSAIDVEERLRRLSEAEVTDDAEAIALARLRLFISRREYLAPAGVPSGRRVLGIMGGASLIAAAGTAGAIAIAKHGGSTARAPQPAVSPSPPVASTPSMTPVPTPTAAPTPTPAPTPSPVPLSTYPAIDQLVMVSAKEGWAVAHGKVVRTTDGALTWSDATPPGLTVPADLINPSLAVQIAALDANHAWVYDSPGSGASTTPADAYVYRTLDGGRSWARATVARGQSASSSSAYGPLDILSPTAGFLVIDRGGAAGSHAAAVYRTTDGGMTWTLMSETDTTASGDFYTTPTRGIPLPGSKDGLGFRDAQTGWVGGGSAGGGVLYVSRDSGAHWQRVRIAVPGGIAAGAELLSLTPPRFVSSQVGFLDAEIGEPNASGPVRAVYVTQDGGATWTGHRVPTGAGLAQAVTASLVVAIGGDGTVYTSDDAGGHWSSTGPHPQLAGSAAPHFVNARVGFVLVTNPNSGATTLWATQDGGATFTRLGR